MLKGRGVAQHNLIGKRNLNLIGESMMAEMVGNISEVLGQQSNDLPRKTIERDIRYVSQLKTS
jgi:hypothetical protein